MNFGGKTALSAEKAVSRAFFLLSALHPSSAQSKVCRAWRDAERVFEADVPACCTVEGGGAERGRRRAKAPVDP